MNNNFCPNCGMQVAPGQVCPNCGAQPAMNQMNMNGMQQNVQLNMQQTDMAGMNMQQQFQQMNMQQQFQQMNMQQQMPVNDNWKNKNAILGLVFGIISFFIFGFMAFIGLGLAINGLNESKQHGGKGKTVAIIAIVIDSICSLLVLLNMILSIVAA